MRSREEKKTTCTLWGQDGRIFVRSSYDPEWVEWFKFNIPRGSRSWDPQQKVWTFDPAFLDEVHAKCEETFDAVTIVEDEAQNGSSKGDAYAAFLRPLPNDMLKKIWRLVAKELHPDHGGDKNLATEVTSAWNQIKQERGL